MTPFELTRFLSDSALFSGLTDSELACVVQICQYKHLKRGEVVFRVGDVCEAFHIVAAGQVKLFMTSPLGNEKVIEIFSAGQSFAEANMFLDKPYIFNAQALSDATLLVISKQGVFGEIARDPKFAMHMLGGVSRRLQTLIQDVEGYALKNGVQRLIMYLLRDIDLSSPLCANSLVVTLPASKGTIASRLSLTPEYFSRVLHDLASKHLIELDGRDIRIADVHKLMAFGST